MGMMTRIRRGFAPGPLSAALLVLALTAAACGGTDAIVPSINFSNAC